MEPEVPIYGKNNYYNSYSSEERIAEERAIDDWLPITSSRTARWWFSAFHNVTAIVGAGVLSLPYAMSQLGWGPGVSFLVLSWVVTLYSLWQMVEMHELVPGKRFDRYHELGQHAFGHKLGLWIVVPVQLVVLAGLNIVYLITGGTSLQKFHHLVCKDCKKIKLTYFILIFSSVHFALSQLPTFNSISGVSLVSQKWWLVKKGQPPNICVIFKNGAATYHHLQSPINTFFSSICKIPQNNTKQSVICYRERKILCVDSFSVEVIHE